MWEGPIFTLLRVGSQRPESEPDWRIRGTRATPTFSTVRDRRYREGVCQRRATILIAADTADARVWEMKVNVVVKPKDAVLDPQGGAVRDAMRHLGMPEVRSVRIGKFMEIDVDGEGVEVEKRLHGLCRELLSNPVIEDYEVRKPEVRSQTSDIRGQKSEVSKKQ
jgi:phosphoribosylformylglycinamidine synthase PurS subunit